MRSFDPPPVTPSLKLPPRFGVPVVWVPVVVELLLLPPHAASTASMAAPPAPASSWRRVYALSTPRPLWRCKSFEPPLPVSVMVTPSSRKIAGVVVRFTAAPHLVRVIHIVR